MDLLACMRAFVAIADCGSFTVASQRLHRSRAMTSKLVVDLEAHLGLRLLLRTTRKVALTEAGAAYFERCRDVLGALDDAEREATSNAAEPVGQLRVSAPVAFGTLKLAPVVSAYAKQHGRIRVDLVLSDRFVDLVDEGYDLAIRIGRLSDSSLVARRISSAKVVLSGAPKYLRERGVPRVPADLSAHDVIQYAYQSGGTTWKLRGPDGLVHEVRPQSRVTCNNGGAIARMAVAGLGLSLQPEFIVAGELESGALRPVLERFTRDELGIYAVHASHRHVPLKIRSFIDFLVDAFQTGTPRPPHAGGANRVKGGPSRGRRGARDGDPPSKA